MDGIPTVTTTEAPVQAWLADFAAAIGAIFTFETATGPCNGVLRLVNDGGVPRAWTLMTALDEIGGHEDPANGKRWQDVDWKRSFGGENWRNRNPALTRRNEARVNHPPCTPFPKDMLANRLGLRAEAMELNVRTGTALTAGSWDEAARCWTVTPKRADGSERALRPAPCMTRRSPSRTRTCLPPPSPIRSIAGRIGA